MRQFRKFTDDKSLLITAAGLVLGIVASVYFGPTPLIVISVAAVLYTLIRWFDGSVADAQNDALISEIKKTLRESIEKKAEEADASPVTSYVDEPTIGHPRIIIIGIGGGGSNAVNRMIEAGVKGVEYIVANTDLQALNTSKAPIKIQLGTKSTRGLGAGSNPDVGREAALEDHQKLLDVLEGSDMVFVIAGMGGGTGTGAAPVVASLAIELGALTVAVVTKPFKVEGKRRVHLAERGITELRGCVDTLITIPNSLLRAAEERLTLLEAFRRADESILDAVQAIASLVTKQSHINLDFADVASILRSSGDAVFGTGIGNGTGSATKAMQFALKSPLLAQADLENANSWLVTFSAGPDLVLGEVEDAICLVEDVASDNAEIVWADIVNTDNRDEIKVTLIATRFNQHGATWSTNYNRQLEDSPSVSEQLRRD